MIMLCDEVREILGAYVDRALEADEFRQVAAHLDSCVSCARAATHMEQLRHAMRRMPQRAPMPKLQTSLQVLASRERARVLNTSISLSDRMRLAFQSSMRPMALPVFGGFLGSVILFSMFMPALTIPVHAMTHVRDVPTALSTDPSVTQVRYPANFDLGDAELVIDLTVDEQGHMLNYAVVEGGNVLQNNSVRRQLENSLLFTDFAPATRFGGPAISKVRLLISSSQVTVEG